MAEQKLEQGVLYVKRYPASFDILYFVFKQYSIEDEHCKFMLKYDIQKGSSENLKQVPQNFTEVLNIDDITDNDVIQKNQHRTEKEINLGSKVIIDVKLASWLKKDSEICFSFLWKEHCHSKIPGALLCEYVCITVLF